LCAEKGKVIRGGEITIMRKIKITIGEILNPNRSRNLNRFSFER